MIKKLLFVLIIASVSVSCVSKKKYAEMETLKNNIQKMLDDKNSAIREKEKENQALRDKLDDCNEVASRLRQDSTVLSNKRNQLNEELMSLKGQCDQLQENYQQLRNQSSKKMQAMVDQLEELQRDLAQREKRLAEVEAMLNRRDSTIRAIEKKVADALLGFRDKGLTVEVKNGQVYVSLSNKLLFASGSTKIDQSGQQALRDLAAVLKEQPDITIMVEGHTDDVPVSNLGQIKDNWDLSVMRSTEVVRILVESGLQSTRVIPSGRSQFIPKVEGSTPEARASNRRTEIIISPKLDDLFNLINSKDGN